MMQRILIAMLTLATLATVPSASAGPLADDVCAGPIPMCTEVVGGVEDGLCENVDLCVPEAPPCTGEDCPDYLCEQNALLCVDGSPVCVDEAIDADDCIPITVADAVLACATNPFNEAEDDLSDECYALASPDCGLAGSGQLAAYCEGAFACIESGVVTGVGTTEPGVTQECKDLTDCDFPPGAGVDCASVVNCVNSVGTVTDPTACETHCENHEEETNLAGFCYGHDTFLGEALGVADHTATCVSEVALFAVHGKFASAQNACDEEIPAAERLVTESTPMFAFSTFEWLTGQPVPQGIVDAYNFVYDLINEN